MTDYSTRLAEHARPVLARAEELREEYRTASPWPHLLLDDLLDPAVLAEAYEQEKGRAAHLALRRTHRQAKAETHEGFGPAATAVLDFLDSDPVRDLLVTVTGIEDLEPDTGHRWAGLHANPAGAFHALHQDFADHPVDGRWHRVNILVYLNPEWPAEWGGALELWHRDGREPAAVVAPHAPHTVVFETGPHTVHGLPDPITAPDGIARISLNSFYYTPDRAPLSMVPPVWRRPRRPQDGPLTGVATYGEIVNGLSRRTPDSLRDLRRRVLARVRG